MRHKQKKSSAVPHRTDKRSTPMPTVQLAVAIVPVDTAGADHSQTAASSKAAATAPVGHAGQAPASLSGSSEANPQVTPEAWDALPAPALVQIGSSLPQHNAVVLRLVCKAWATHLGDVLTEAAPSPYPLLAHEAACNAGVKSVHLQHVALMQTDNSTSQVWLNTFCTE